MVEKELGEWNFGFDSEVQTEPRRKELLPGIVAPLPAARCRGTTAASPLHGGACRGIAATVELTTRRRLPRQAAVEPAADVEIPET